MKNEILIQNGFLPTWTTQSNSNTKNVQSIGTVLSNFAYYGYVPSKEILNQLINSSKNQIEEFWNDIKPALKKITGDDRKVGKHVVYKNFPKEVLDMSESQYWFNQICMYWGLPNHLFTQEKENRKPMKEIPSLKVLHLEKNDTLTNIYNDLTKLPNKWNDNQNIWANWLFDNYHSNTNLDVSSFGFKENAISLAKKSFINNFDKININSATDVLRLAAALSEQDVSLRTNVKFKKFNRQERKKLLSILDNQSNLEDDFGRRPEEFKRLLKQLHPGDYKFQNVIDGYNKLYKNDIQSFNSKVESLLIQKNEQVLNLLETKPGDLLRRFHHLYETFQSKSIDSFALVANQMTTQQLVKFEKYINTINNRQNLFIPPKGNWSKAKIFPVNKEKIQPIHLEQLNNIIHTELSNRLNKLFPDGVFLEDKTNEIKLQTNDQKLSSYGRGTQFDIPDNINFIRTASYWEEKQKGNVWFDNGWNFFDSNWQPLATICWNNINMKGAAFSGDPTNSKNADGKATQLIDLYLNTLEKQGIRYAVWNVLAFSGIKFSDAKDVFAGLQWGEDAQKGKLFEPSRTQLAFALKDDSLSKYVAYIDIKKRKLVYIDANLKADNSSAKSNDTSLSTQMPAYLEYIQSLPSVYDLFKHAKQNPNGIPILYSDDKYEIKANNAYVFKKENTSNSFNDINLSHILDETPIKVDKKVEQTAKKTSKHRL